MKLTLCLMPLLAAIAGSELDIASCPPISTDRAP
jgi:hypothetical protein